MERMAEGRVQERRNRKKMTPVAPIKVHAEVGLGLLISNRRNHQWTHEMATMSKSKAWWIGICGAAWTMYCTGVAAQTLSPSKPIRIIVPVAAGAATDTLARMAGDWLGKKTGLSIIMENRTGAGGNIALEQVAKGEPDGHTLLVATNGAITINPVLFKKGAVDTLIDVVPVAMLAEMPQIVAINGKLPARTAREFIALARERPGTINYGSAGLGTTPHLTLAFLAKLAGIDLVHVPYRGMAPAVTDLIAGNIQAIAVGNATVAPFVEAGQLRVIATASPSRLSYLPDVPMAAEIGLPTWHVETWYGLFAPRGTPKPIVDQLNHHIMTMFDDAASAKRIEESFYTIVRLTADDYAARVRFDIARWSRIVREAGIEVQ
jgi:tripartite-type tricarboxylate transporter receptor subunit TctC